MSSLANVLDNPTTGGKTYYDSENDKPKVRMPEGEYPANIIKVDCIERMIRGKYKALIYNLSYRLVSEDTSELDAVDFDGNDCKVKTGVFGGREFKGQGVFKFLQPNGSDNFEPNPSGNRAYSNLCEVIGLPAKIVEIDINGKKTKVRELNDLKEKDILGKPVMACIKKGKPWKSDLDGKTRFPLTVKWLKKWEGTPLSDDEIFNDKKDDLPF
jgi:hypothetical protein